MNKIQKLLIGSLIAVIINSCENSSPTQNLKIATVPDIITLDSLKQEPFFDINDTIQNIKKDQAIKIALNIIPGDVKDIYSSYYRGIYVWTVIIQTSNEGVIKIQVDIEFGIVVNVKNLTEEVDCDIIPSKNHIKLSEVSKIALKKYPGKITMWEVEYHLKYHWVYIIKIKSKSKMFTIMIKAKNGLFIDEER